MAAISMYQKEGIAAACTHLNISRTLIYKWNREYEALGDRAFSSKVSTSGSTEIQKLIAENRQLKQLVADKELKLMIQEELLKKSQFR